MDYTYILYYTVLNLPAKIEFNSVSENNAINQVKKMKITGKIKLISKSNNNVIYEKNLPNNGTSNIGIKQNTKG